MDSEYNYYIIRVTQLCEMYITLAPIDCGDDGMCTFPA
jgi:hypothetical protein